jgi:hypothetical protein
VHKLVLRQSIIRAHTGYLSCPVRLCDTYQLAIALTVEKVGSVDDDLARDNQTQAALV